MRERLSYANVMATVAVFLALGGSSYAAVKLTGRDIKDSSLTGTDVKNNSLGSADIRTGAVRSADIANGTVRAQDIQLGVLPAGEDTYYWANVAEGDMRLARTTGKAFVFFLCGQGGGTQLEVDWSGITPIDSMTWWYGGTFGVTNSTGDGLRQRFNVPAGDGEHTFRGLRGGYSVIVRFNAHVNPSTCTFAATVLGANNSGNSD